MTLAQRLDPVLDVVKDNAEQVDTAAEFPKDGVEALRASGLLGLTLPVEVGGLGGGPVELSEVLTALASACGSTAMVYLMHVSAAMAIAKSPPPGYPDLLRDLAVGRQLATLALSEKGSRSHFWAPVSRCTQVGEQLRVRADKSFVTSAGHADLYLASTLSPVGGPTETSFIAIPASTAGLDVVGAFTGLGLRGNASAPMTIDITVPAASRLPAAGFDLTFDVVLPWFSIGNAAVSLGLAQGALDLAIAHVSKTRLEHEGTTLAELPTVRSRVARASVAVAVHRAYIVAAARSIAAPDEATMTHVLGVKATANEMALTVTDEAMRVCGGAAFARALPVERYFRDARAGAVMAPTSDVLFDFYGKAVTGLPLF